MDNDAEAFPLHVRCHSLREPQGSADVDLKHKFERLWRDRQRLTELVGADRVDQDVRHTHLAGNPIDEGLRDRWIGGVCHFAANSRWQRAQSGFISIDSDRGVPGRVQGDSGRLTESASGTNDDGYRGGHNAVLAKWIGLKAGLNTGRQGGAGSRESHMPL